MPYILNPNVCAGCEEEPLDWDEEVADDVRSDGHTHKEDGECLASNENRKINRVASCHM